MKSILSIPRAKYGAEAATQIQKLEELISRYQRNKAKDFDEDIQVQKIYDILPPAVENHLVLENRDKQPSRAKAACIHMGDIEYERPCADGNGWVREDRATPAPVPPAAPAATQRRKLLEHRTLGPS